MTISKHFLTDLIRPRESCNTSHRHLVRPEHGRSKSSSPPCAPTSTMNEQDNTCPQPEVANNRTTYTCSSSMALSSHGPSMASNRGLMTWHTRRSTPMRNLCDAYRVHDAAETPHHTDSGFPTRTIARTRLNSETPPSTTYLTMLRNAAMTTMGSCRASGWRTWVASSSLSQAGCALPTTTKMICVLSRDSHMERPQGRRSMSQPRSSHSPPDCHSSKRQAYSISDIQHS